MRFAYVLILVFSMLVGPIVYATQDKILTYTKELNRVTKKGQMFDYDTWDAKIIWRATFFDDQFRKQYAKKHAAIHYMGPEEEKQWMSEQKLIQNREWDFIIVMYSKKDYKKFSMDSDSFWEIIMTTDVGEDVYPISIEQIPITPYEKIMFPHVDRWSKMYRVAFPKVELGDRVKITMRSVVGKSSLEWKIH